MQDPNEDTEWNEILRDFGILPPKEEPKDEIEEMVLRLQKEAMVKPYEKMTLAELKEAEDEFDDEDMRAIEIYREKRLQEWKVLKKKQKFGELREISGNQYVNEVTNAEKDVWVIIHLYRSSIPMCLLVNQHLSLLARKFPETKFVKAIVNSCIEHYHDNCLPTIFVYKNGQIEGKFIGIIECGGINLKLKESLLKGAFPCGPTVLTVKESNFPPRLDKKNSKGARPLSSSASALQPRTHVRSPQAHSPKRSD
ncbi:phosducin-like protein 2 [Moschus berezovskii]|uniref:phosducin-like protein 2 n=1 Tax=Moschus berezovskii TaxID=68408 RepID=UPI002443EEDF|nr:phosducin-like protein 2 [Moschus berezovskii]